MTVRLAMIAFALVAGLSARAASDDIKEYKPLMKAGASAADELKDALEGKDAAAAKASSEELSRSMTQIAEFWKARNTADAVELALKVKAAAEDAAAKAAANDFDAALASFDTAKESCDGCHKAHRKMSLGGWKLK